MTRNILLVGILSAAFLTPVQAQEPTNTQLIAYNCFVCHGENGQSRGRVPKLNGFPANYIESMMKAYKSGEQKGSIMNRIAKGYTDEEIAAIARFFSQQK
ncbi:MAG: c-type cytochrome [Pseudomonadota bacterium]